MASVTLPPNSVATAPSRRRNYGRIAEQTWIWSVVGYTVLRFVIAWGAFSEHGANVWIFGILDVGTAWPYAKAIAAVCKRAANNEWRRVPLPAGVALASFFAPYAYLWFAAGEMPAGVRIGMAIFVSVLLIAATAGVLTKTRKLRREADEVVDVREPGTVVVAAFADTDGDVVDLRTPAPVGDVIIDLTGTDVTVERAAAHH